jgi:hypothetical protein
MVTPLAWRSIGKISFQEPSKALIFYSPVRGTTQGETGLIDLRAYDMVGVT